MAATLLPVCPACATSSLLVGAGLAVGRDATCCPCSWLCAQQRAAALLAPTGCLPASTCCGCCWLRATAIATAWGAVLL